MSSRKIPAKEVHTKRRSSFEEPVKGKKAHNRNNHRKSVRWDKIIAFITVVVIIIFAYIIYKDITKGDLVVETKASEQMVK